MSGGEWLQDWVDQDLPLWAGVPAQSRADLLASLEPMSLIGGQVLFAQGDQADALYVLVAGAVGISSMDNAGVTRRVARILPPDTLGEMAVISGEPRSATAVALRDSVLLRLSAKAFERLAERWPGALLYVARLLADRLRTRTRNEPLTRSARTIAILPASDGAPTHEIGRALLSRMGKEAVLLDTFPANADEAWFHRVESQHERILYVAGEPRTAWTELCRRRADHAIYVTRPGERRHCDAPEAGGADDWRKQDLVVVHDDLASAPGAAVSVAGWRADLLIHVRLAVVDDMDRLARIVLGQAVGMVLSGGGARGFAHLGVVRAWLEHGRPVDLIGGTSIGAVIGASLAAGWTLDDIEARLREAFMRRMPLNDFTLPLVALLRGGKVDAMLARTFGDLQIESLWRPFFCVSSNLTLGRVHVHRRGPLAQALRASVAIPGLLPPVVTAEGVLADGALMNNLPIDVMADLARGPVVAVDVARDLALQPGSSRSMLRQLFGIDPASPSIVSLLLRAATVSSDAQGSGWLALADQIIRPRLDSVGLGSWRSFDEAVSIGYRAAHAMLNSGTPSQSC